MTADGPRGRCYGLGDPSLLARTGDQHCSRVGTRNIVLTGGAAVLAFYRIASGIGIWGSDQVRVFSGRPPQARGVIVW